MLNVSVWFIRENMITWLELLSNLHARRKFQPIRFPKWKYQLWHSHWNPITGVGRTSTKDIHSNSKSIQEVTLTSSISMKIKYKELKYIFI